MAYMLSRAKNVILLFFFFFLLLLLSLVVVTLFVIAIFIWILPHVYPTCCINNHS